MQTASPPSGNSVSHSIYQPQAHQATDMSKKRKRQASSPPATQSQPRMASEIETDEHTTHIEPDYFPVAFEYMFGPIAFPPTPATSQWPNNIAFYCTDWMKVQQERSFLERENEEGWDVILACVLDSCAKRASISLSRLPRLSIAKWIHLHGGDDGLLEFFRRVYRLLKPGGVFVLEPQEWEGYKSAKRMDRVSRYPWSFQSFACERSGFLTETGGKREASKVETRRVWRGTSEDWIHPRRDVWHSRGRRYVYDSPLSGALNLDSEPGFKRALYAYHKPSSTQLCD